MSDKAGLQIQGQRIENFKSYFIESNLFTAADGFRFELANPEINIKCGSQCRLFINGRPELVGIVERIEEKYDKQSAGLEVSGRDLMGLLVDSSCEDLTDMQNIGLKALANKLLAKFEFAEMKNIVYGSGSKLRPRAAAAPEDSKSFKAEPGQSIFDVLKGQALRRGLLFFCLSDGTFVFGEPLTSGAAKYEIIMRRDGRGNNALSCEHIRDISGGHKTIKALGQQGGETDANVSGSVTNPDYPFHKPLVMVIDGDAQSPKSYAKMRLNKERFDSDQFVFTVPGHGQNGLNWQVNEVCHVVDERFGIDADMLIYSRTFELSKDKGHTTTLKLSQLGALPE